MNLIVFLFFFLLLKMNKHLIQWLLLTLFLCLSISIQAQPTHMKRQEDGELNELHHASLTRTATKTATATATPTEKSKEDPEEDGDRMIPANATGWGSKVYSLQDKQHSNSFSLCISCCLWNRIWNLTSDGRLGWRIDCTRNLLVFLWI